MLFNLSLLSVIKGIDTKSITVKRKKIMKKLFATLIVCMMATVSFAQSNTNYYDQYGRSTGSATTRSNYGGGSTTTYYDQYGRNTGSSKRR